MKHSSEFTKLLTAESYTFPFALKNNPLFQNKKISLELLNIKINKINWIKTTMDETQQNLINITINNPAITFNIYANGKVRVWHNLNHEAIHYFLDFFYHTFIIYCLVEMIE